MYVLVAFIVAVPSLCGVTSPLLASMDAHALSLVTSHVTPLYPSYVLFGVYTMVAVVGCVTVSLMSIDIDLGLTLLGSICVSSIPVVTVHLFVQAKNAHLSIQPDARNNQTAD